MRIGVDFGTTNSAICFLDENKIVQAIPFGNAANAVNYIPSCVAIQSGASSAVRIGRPAKLKFGQAGWDVYTNFKMLLGETDLVRRSKWGYAKRSSDDIAAIYFRQLLADVCKYSGSTLQAVVVTIPEVWTSQGLLEKREHLLAVCKSAGMPEVKLHSEPLAAAVYFLYLYRKKNKKPFQGHILVCDCGGGTLDFCLVRVHVDATGKEQVTALQRTGNGLVGESLGKAGVAYDEAVTEALFPGLRKNDAGRFFECLRKFEEQKIGDPQSFSDATNLFREEPDLAADPFTAVEGVGIRAKLLCDTFDRLVKPGLLEALAEMKRYLISEQVNIEDSTHFRVLPVGGFSTYEPVIRTIKDFFNSRLDGDGRFQSLMSVQDTALAIAKGAALIAEEMVDIIQVCPITMGLVTKVASKNFEPRYLPLLVKGQRLDQYRQAVMDPTKLYYVENGSQNKLQIFFDINGVPCTKDLPVTISGLLPQSFFKSPEGSYLLCGFSVDDNQVFTLHLHHRTQDGLLKGARETSLGKILDSLNGSIQHP